MSIQQENLGSWTQIKVESPRLSFGQVATQNVYQTGLCNTAIREKKELMPRSG